MQSPDLAALYERRTQLLMDMYVAKGAYFRSGRRMERSKALRESYRACHWLVRDIDQEIRAAMGFVPLTRDEMIVYRRAQKQKQFQNNKK
mgnify:CR=1 FL=1